MCTQISLDNLVWIFKFNKRKFSLILVYSLYNTYNITVIRPVGIYKAETVYKNKTRLEIQCICRPYTLPENVYL